MNTLVIIPTFNERENISRLLDAIRLAGYSGDALVVDDNSPDGTGKVVEAISAQDDKVHLLSRPGKQGLGRAYLAGFAWALSRDYDFIIEMDADFSHRPIDLVTLSEKLKSTDFVVGSRWVPGGRTVNWGTGRKIISRGGSWYSRTILGYGLKDWTGGFNGWQAKVLRGIDLKSVASEGYSFQIELKYRALRAGFAGLEIPIVFEDRRAGKSKMSSKIVFEALLRVWSIKRANWSVS
jgi:dolichol-phosphate mannosyltransferase